MMKNINRKFQAYYPLLWLLVIPVLNLFYGFLNHGGGTVNSLMTDLDTSIPLVPVFIIPYLLWYPYILLMLFLFFVKNKKVYYRTLFIQCMGLVISYIIYFFFQTTVSRPTIPDHGFLNQLITFVYNTDNPYNCFPSIHVLTSYLMIKGVNECITFAKKTRMTVYFCSWLIIASTLFVKQHVLLDVAGGIAVVEIVHFIVYQMLPSKSNLLAKGVVRSE